MKERETARELQNIERMRERERERARERERERERASERERERVRERECVWVPMLWVYMGHNLRCL